MRKHVSDIIFFGIFLVLVFLLAATISTSRTILYQTEANSSVVSEITFGPNQRQQKQSTFKYLSPMPPTDTPIPPPPLPGGSVPTTGPGTPPQITAGTGRRVTDVPRRGSGTTTAPQPTVGIPTVPTATPPRGATGTPPAQCPVGSSSQLCSCSHYPEYEYYQCGPRLPGEDGPVVFYKFQENYMKVWPNFNTTRESRSFSSASSWRADMAGYSCTYECKVYDKPVLYLYPEIPTYVSVRLDIPGKVIKSIPEYGNGWFDVFAYPDGKLQYKGKTYGDLFYETVVHETASTRNEGYLIHKKSLQADLSKLIVSYGLIGREKKEFLEYWVPRLQKEPGPAFFTRVLTLDEKNTVDRVLISPEPDTFIHFLVEFKSVKENYVFKQQSYPTPPERKGFTVVEWGGGVLLQ